MKAILASLASLICLWGCAGQLSEVDRSPGTVDRSRDGESHDRENGLSSLGKKRLTEQGLADGLVHKVSKDVYGNWASIQSALTEAFSATSSSVPPPDLSEAYAPLLVFAAVFADLQALKNNLPNDQFLRIRGLVLNKFSPPIDLRDLSELADHYQSEWDSALLRNEDPVAFGIAPILYEQLLGLPESTYEDRAARQSHRVLLQLSEIILASVGFSNFALKRYRIVRGDSPMNSGEGLFLLLVRCVLDGTPENVTKVCTSPEMIGVPYVATPIDETLPAFDQGHWFTLSIGASVPARLEVLFKEEQVLQAGVQIIYDEQGTDAAARDFRAIERAADRHYGLGVSLDMGPVENKNYGDGDTVFYVTKYVANRRDILTFRVGNRRFWK